MPEVVGAGRGPLCTSGIEDLRTGAYREHQAAVRFSIHNDGWGWATGSPYADLDALIEMDNQFGAGLRRGLVDRVSRQVLIDCMIEVLPDESNRVSVDPRLPRRCSAIRARSSRSTCRATRSRPPPSRAGSRGGSTSGSGPRTTRRYDPPPPAMSATTAKAT